MDVKCSKVTSVTEKKKIFKFTFLSLKLNGEKKLQNAASLTREIDFEGKVKISKEDIQGKQFLSTCNFSAIQSSYIHFAWAPLVV